jgi:hypothetical protein
MFKAETYLFYIRKNMVFMYRFKGALIYASVIYGAYIKDFLCRLLNIKNFEYDKDVKELAICIACKDDEVLLKENIEYHSLIGIDHFIIYDNNSKTPLKNALKDYNNVTVINWPYRFRHPLCFRDCLNKFKQKFKWIAFIDTDEFIVMKDGTIDLKAFLKPYRKYGGLAVNWCCFGSSGHLKTQKSVIQSFTESCDTESDTVKSIVNTEKVLISSRNPHGFFYKKGYFCVNEKFERLPIKTSFLSAPIYNPISNDKIQINHYVTRSKEDFEARQKRAKAFNKNTIWDIRSSEKFWESFQNGKKDTAILDLIKKLKSSSP